MVIIESTCADQYSGGQDHRTEDGEGDAAPADAVGEHATVYPGQRPQQWPQEGDLGRVQRGPCRALTAGDEVDLQQLTKREREPDERTEGADVEQCDHPGVPLG